MKIKNLIIASMLLFGSLNAADKFTAGTKMIISQAEKIETKYDQLADNSRIQYPFSIQNEGLTVNLTLETTGENIKSKLEAVGCKIITHTKTIYCVQIPTKNIDRLIALPEVKTIDAGKMLNINTDESLKAINADNVTAAGSSLPNSVLAGEGVLVGVVDTGLDLYHPDFRNENGSRVRYFWNMVSDDPTRHPESFDFGSEFTNADIDADLSQVPCTDIIGHGTHVTGIAAGGGMADSKYRGIAYNSDIIAVKATENGGMTLETMIAGCQYIIEKAKEIGKPVVINLSLSSSMPVGFDGTDPLSQAINELSSPGVIIVAGAGNNGSVPLHAGTTLSADKKIFIPTVPQKVQFLPFPYPEYQTDDLFYSGSYIWYDKNSIDSVKVGIFNIGNLLFGDTIPQASISFSVNEDLENKEIILNDGTKYGYLCVEHNNGDDDSKDASIFILFHNGGEASDISYQSKIFAFETTGKSDGKIDVWATATISQDLLPIPLTVPGKEVVCSDKLQSIGSPAIADSAVSVGAFITKTNYINKAGETIDLSADGQVGNCATFSSKGPRRDGKILPTISAPGAIVMSALSSTMDATHLESLGKNLVPSEKYIGMNGTSMATPHVSGVVALMLQINPKLSADEAMKILQATATVDEFTGEVPNPNFGGGKVNAQKAINYMLGASAKDYVMANDVKVFPLPAQNDLNIELEFSPENGNNSLSIYNETGIRQNVNYDIIGEQLKLNVENLNSGIYVGEFRSGNYVSKFKFVVK